MTPRIHFTSLINCKSGRLVLELTYLAIYEVYLIHVELLRSFENTKVTLTPNQDLVLGCECSGESSCYNLCNSKSIERLNFNWLKLDL